MKRIIYLLLILLFATSCSKRSVTIGSIVDTRTGSHAFAELQKYLALMYPAESFEFVMDDPEADIQLLLTVQLNDPGYDVADLPEDEESFKIINHDGSLLLISPDERGLLNAVYALLEKQGCGFYISGDKIPEPRKWKGYEDWEMEDRPVLEDRNLFSWHNFLSGCTGWDLEDWKLWIDQANKMRYNGIMVHAYGNNPMFSYEYLGETKPTGYLNNSANGRDWGNQHVNDVRRLVGGEIFEGPVYGARPSFATEEQKVAELTEMMHNVFEYAEKCGTRVIFALDFDTWMSHPSNIVESLPGEAVIELNGHLTPNPEHHEGFNYYRHQLKELLTKYPQIDELTAWSRSPRNKVNSVLGTIWMAFPLEKFPAGWKEEYAEKIGKHANLVDDLRTQSMFAFGKVVAALQRAAEELDPGLEIGYGSWGFEWLGIADAFLPEGITFRPLDASIVFDTEKSVSQLTSVAEGRHVRPVIWAHHDDFSYIGRPYAPYTNLTDMVSERRVSGLGIIHWTTHPLDLYFTGTARQLWHATSNEELETTVRSFVGTAFGEPAGELVDYYYEWLTEGPMFGRETSDHFMDLGKRHWKSNLDPWNKLIDEAKKRLLDLEQVPGKIRNDYWEYQKGMEQFYISFFENQMAFDTAYMWIGNGEAGKAKDLMIGTDPDITIEKYVAALQHTGFSPGEEALVLSLNTRWKTDFSNLKQRLGMEPVRVKFSPTRHDPLAQVPGKNTYYIDNEGDWWICFWEQELINHTFIEENGRTALVIGDEPNIALTTMHGQALPPGTFELSLDADLKSAASCRILEDGKETYVFELNDGEKPGPIRFSCEGGYCELSINSHRTIKLYELEINPVKL